MIDQCLLYSKENLLKKRISYVRILASGLTLTFSGKKQQRNGFPNGRLVNNIQTFAECDTERRVAE